MATPQVENGYFRVSNEVFDKLSRAVSGAEFQVAMVLIRRTWGWNLKEASISLNDFVQSTPLSKSSVVRALDGLCKKNVVILLAGNVASDAKKWRLNKDWESWTIIRKRVLKIGTPEYSNSVPPGTQNEYGGVLKMTSLEQINLLETKNLPPPKDSLKTNIKTKSIPVAEKRDGRKPDQAYELFAEAFKQKRSIPYQNSKGDFVQLAARKKSLGLVNGSVPDGWEKALENYFASPLSKYTLADLCARYDVFLAGPIDRFGKPPAQQTFAEPESYYQKLLRKP